MVLTSWLVYPDGERVALPLPEPFKHGDVAEWLVARPSHDVTFVVAVDGEPFIWRALGALNTGDTVRWELNVQ